MTSVSSTKKLNALIAIFGLVFVPFHAFALYTSDLHSAPDSGLMGDTVDPFVNPIFGSVFTPSQDWDISGGMIWACGSSTSYITNLKIYHLLNGTSTDLTSPTNYELIATLPLSIPECVIGDFPIPENPPEGTFDTVRILANEYYMIKPADTDLYLFHDFYFGVSSDLDQYGVAICAPEFSGICGTSMAIGLYGARIAFNFSPFALEPPPEECGLLTLNVCVQMALEWAFYPSANAFDNFSTLADTLKDRAPFGYFTSGKNALLGLNATSATPAFTLATSTPIMATIFAPMRSGMNWVLLFAGVVWIYKRVTDIVV
jgi:hypothetical protein